MSTPKEKQAALLAKLLPAEKGELVRRIILAEVLGPPPGLRKRPR